MNNLENLKKRYVCYVFGSRKYMRVRAENIIEAREKIRSKLPEPNRFIIREFKEVKKNE